MRASPRLQALIGLASALISGGCGGVETTSLDTEIPPCDRANTAVCKKACTCGGSSGCLIVDPVTEVTVTFQSEDDCLRDRVEDRCAGGGNPDVDYPACQFAAETGVCTGDAEPKALELPEACLPSAT